MSHAADGGALDASPPALGDSVATSLSHTSTSHRSDPYALDLPRLRAALHPPDRPPAAAAWNADELADLVSRTSPAVPAAVLIALVPRADGVRVLLTVRTDSMRNHAGQVSFPGGRIESSDPDPVQAALREAREEVGLDPALVEPLGYLDSMLTVTGFLVYPVVAQVSPDYVLDIDPGEVAEAFEVPLAYLLDARNSRRAQAEFRGRIRHYYEFGHAPQRIWGVTAAMLINLRERLAQVG